MDINELISAAQEGIEKSELTFDPALQRYFDPELNLYYSPESRDYFDKRNGAYYKRIDGELIRTGQDERFKPARPEEEESDSENEQEDTGPTVRIDDFPPEITFRSLFDAFVSLNFSGRKNSGTNVRRVQTCKSGILH